MNFKSKAAYNAWLKYGHASGEFAKTPGNQPVSIQGKSHGVQHAFGGEMYAAGGSFNNPGFAKLPKDVQAKIKARSFASGGPMAQLTEFTEGGRHEENPIGGIPQGFAPDGQPNLVEQGETKLNSDDYIYSDTLKVTKDIALDFSLPKNYIGKTFAEVSKEANRPKSRRENDTIEVIAIKRDLDNLMQAQEEFKKRDLEKDMQMMMEKHPQEMQQMMAGAQGAPQGPPQEGMAPGQEMQGPPPEMAPEGQIPQSAQMGMPQGQPMDPSQMPPEMLAQMQGAQQGQPVMRMGGNMYMCGGKMYDFGGFMDDNNNAIGGAAKGAMSGAATGASIGLNPALLAATGGLSAVAVPIGAAIGGITSGIKGSKADKAENAADAEAARFATAQSQAMNANALMPDMNNVVNSPYQETISPMGMMGQSYDAGGWMNSNANAIGNTGQGFMSGASAGLTAGKQFDVAGQTPWGSIIGAGVGAIGGGIGGAMSGRQEDEQAQREQQAMYAQGKTARQQSNMMMNAPQMYQQQMMNSMQNPMMNQMNQMNGAQMAKYGGRQYPDGGGLPGAPYPLPYNALPIEADYINRDVAAYPTMYLGTTPLTNNYDAELHMFDSSTQNPKYYRDALRSSEHPEKALEYSQWLKTQPRPSHKTGGNLKSHSFAPGGALTGPITGYKMTPAQFAAYYPNYNYATEVKGWKDNPKGKLGEPLHGDDYLPMTATQRAEGIAYYESIPASQIDPHTWANYQQLISGTPVFPNSYWHDNYDPAVSWEHRNMKYLNKPIDLTKLLYNPPAAPTATTSTPSTVSTTPTPAGGAPPASTPTTPTAPAPQGPFYMLNPHTGQPVMDYDPVTKQNVPRVAPEGSISHVPYSQGASMVADNPAARAEEKSDASDRAMSDLIMQNPDEKALWQAHKKENPNAVFIDYRNQRVPTLQQNTTTPAAAGTTIPGSFAYGGNLRSRSYAMGGPVADPPDGITPLPSLGTTHPVTGVAANTGYYYALNPYYSTQSDQFNSVQGKMATDPNYDPKSANVGYIGSMAAGPTDGEIMDAGTGRRAPEQYMQMRLSNLNPSAPTTTNPTPVATTPPVFTPGMAANSNFPGAATEAAAAQAKANANLNGQWAAYKQANPAATYRDFKATLATPETVTTTTPAGNFAMGGMLPEDEGIARLDRMAGGFLNSPGLHSYTTGGGFDGDPVKGETRVNDSGIVEVYNGTEWEATVGGVSPNTINSDLATNYLRSNQQNNPELQNKEATNYDYIKEYQRRLHAADEKLTDKNLDLEINQSLPEFLASAAPAAYNLGQGIFGKAQQLNPQDYMIGANMQPYQYNINPQLREADQSFAQGQEAVRNAGLGGGSYAANMQQLANSRNQAIGGLYAQKQNADAESYNQAMSQNKAIEAQNLERKMGILDFNLKSKAAKTAMLQSGLTQLAQISEGSQSKKLQLALMKALAPDFAGTMAYNSIADQYLNKMKEKKKAKATDKTKG